MNLQEKAQEILKRAEEHGVQSNFFFVTTFKRYTVQLDIMTRLEEKIKEFGPVVTKEYVKNRQNLVTNPAIIEYNKTATAANNTVKTLIDIINNLQAEEDKQNGASGLKDIMKDLMS